MDQSPLPPSGSLTTAERGKLRRRQSEPERIAEYRAAAAEVSQLRVEMEQARDFAIAAMASANKRAFILGTKLIELQERFQGDFDEWLDLWCAEYFSRATAYRWIRKVRDLRAVLGNDNPSLEELKKALIASEVLPEPSPDGAASTAPAPLFRLKLDLAGPTPDLWPPADRRDFLTRAKPVVDLYERVRAAEEAA